MSKSRLSRVALDLTPLRTCRDYRLLWSGQLVSMIGSQLRNVAIPYQVYVLTKSPLAVGLIGLFQAAPLIAFSLWGGVVADAVDRRRVLLVSQTGLMGVSIALAAGTATGHASLPFLYTMAAVGSTLYALDGPARHAMIPELVGRSLVGSAAALNQVMFQTSLVIGPAIGGLIIAGAGLVNTYLVDAFSYIAALTSVALIRTRGAPADGTRPGIKSLMEGLTYLKSNKILLSTMGLDFVAMFFGWPRALFPFFADRIFDVGPQGLGLMFAAPGAGALIGALTSGWVSRIRRQGLAVMLGVAGWGLSIAGFGLLRSGFVLALIFLACAGLADVYSAIFRGTILQLAVPNHLRGRMTSVNLMVVITGPRLGEVESGLVASVTSPAIAIVSGGLACIVAVAFAWVKVPTLRHYTVDKQFPGVHT